MKARQRLRTAERGTGSPANFSGSIRSDEPDTFFCGFVFVRDDGGYTVIYIYRLSAGDWVFPNDREHMVLLVRTMFGFGPISRLHASMVERLHTSALFLKDKRIYAFHYGAFVPLQYAHNVDCASAHSPPSRNARDASKMPVGSQFLFPVIYLFFFFLCFCTCILNYFIKYLLFFFLLNLPLYREEEEQKEKGLHTSRYALFRHPQLTPTCLPAAKGAARLVPTPDSSTKQEKIRYIPRTSPYVGELSCSYKLSHLPTYHAVPASFPVRDPRQLAHSRIKKVHSTGPSHTIYTKLSALSSSIPRLKERLPSHTNILSLFSSHPMPGAYTPEEQPQLPGPEAPPPHHQRERLGPVLPPPDEELEAGIHQSPHTYYVFGDGKEKSTATSIIDPTSPRLHFGPDAEELDGTAAETQETPLPVAPYGWPRPQEFPRWYWKRLTGLDQSLNVYFFKPHYDQLIALLFTATTLVVLGLIQYYVFTPLINGSLNIFLPAFGATCTCLFAVPKLPIAQPRNVLIAHFSAGVIGISCVNILRYAPEQPYGTNIAGAIGVGLHQLFMIYTNTLHPPASATVVSAVQASYQTYYQDRGFLFCVTPCLSGSVVVLVCAIILNNLVPSRSPYPVYW
eukprot:gene6313-4543_t